MKGPQAEVRDCLGPQRRGFGPGNSQGREGSFQRRSSHLTAELEAGKVQKAGAQGRESRELSGSYGWDTRSSTAREARHLPRGESRSKPVTTAGRAVCHF